MIEAYLDRRFGKISESSNVIKGEPFLLECEVPEGVPRVEGK